MFDIDFEVDEQNMKAYWESLEDNKEYDDLDDDELLTADQLQWIYDEPF
jgi:hypothetical protein